jgi:predicted amidohydrolase YtcJ
MSLGSDAPYESLNPLEGIYAAVARRDRAGELEGGWYPEERISVAKAVHGYTMGPAYASAGQEGRARSRRASGRIWSCYRATSSGSRRRRLRRPRRC